MPAAETKRMLHGRELPSLSQHKFLRYFTFISLYFAQGIPEGMLTMGIPAWMAMNGKSAGEIASFTVVAVLPWSFKFVVAPLMDRYTYLKMGRKRPWILIGQLGLLLSCFYMASIREPLDHLTHFMIAAFIISFFGAFQDVATDGLAVDIIPAEEQPKANGLMWGSKICGMSVSLAVGSWLLYQYGFSTAFSVLAVSIGVIMMIPLVLKERPGEKTMPWTPGLASPEGKSLQIENWRVIFVSLVSAFSLRNTILIAILLFIISGGYKYIGTLLPIFTVKELGWTSVEYAQMGASSKLIGGILGMVLGGILIDRFGKKRMMTIYLLTVMIVNTIMAASSHYWIDTSFIHAYMVIQNLLYTFSCIALFAVAMQSCWKKISASQFTLFMTISNLGQMSFAAMIGPVTSVFDWQYSIFFFVILMGLALLIIPFVKLDKALQGKVRFENQDAHPKEKLTLATP